ncbi:hypothetical protein JHK84_036048 [Glycine max]|nr:hypothetical protein JHK84_036048 [Glycine max]
MEFHMEPSNGISYDQILSGNTMALYFSEWLCVGLDVDALDSVNKEEGIVVESSDNEDLTVEVDVVRQWGTFLLFLPFGGAFVAHACDIIGDAKGRNDNSWMAIGFAFDVSE